MAEESSADLSEGDIAEHRRLRISGFRSWNVRVWEALNLKSEVRQVWDLSFVVATSGKQGGRERGEKQNAGHLSPFSAAIARSDVRTSDKKVGVCMQYASSKPCVNTRIYIYINLMRVCVIETLKHAHASVHPAGRPGSHPYRGTCMHTYLHTYLHTSHEKQTHQSIMCMCMDPSWEGQLIGG